MRRRLFRTIARGLLNLLLALVARYDVRGVEHIPMRGPVLLASNHLNHLDPPLMVASVPRTLECVTLASLLEVPIVGSLLRWYGIIPVRRDEFDREVIRQSLDVLKRGGALWVAPEAGMSPTGALIAGRDGVAWLAARSGVPVVPAGFTGTERALADLRRWRRPRITLTFGPPLYLPLPETANAAERKAVLAQHTETLMRRIAALLPAAYRGVYQ
jgi:1-acyl-sn-glycerol-3-phosphate acyltransferase